jgi:ribosomal protein S4E
MKSIVLTSIMALSLNALALSTNSSWSEIFASRMTNVRLPQISFSAGEVTSFLSIEKLCYTDTQIKTVNAQNVYKQVPVSRENSELVVVGKETLATSRVYTKQISDGSEHGMTSIQVSIPLTYKIAVFAASTGDHQSNRVLFSKVFALPACK